MADDETDILNALSEEWRTRHEDWEHGRAGDTPLSLALAEVLMSLLDADDRAADGRCHVCDSGPGERHSGNCPFAVAARAEAVFKAGGLSLD